MVHCSHLEQRGNGQSGNTAVGIGDEILQVHIARGDCVRVDHGNAVEGFHSSKADRRLSRRQEHLKYCMYEIQEHGTN